MSVAIKVLPSSEQKLALLGERASFDLSCACGSETPREKGIDGRWIYPTALPSGKRIPILKVLLQGGCERGCVYCAERCGGEGKKSPGTGSVSFQPEELARVFVQIHQQQRAFGLFLSSAIHKGAVATMDKMLTTAEILRRQFKFRGYLHLKLIPGCQPNQVEAAMALATRVSVNLEAPTSAHLRRLAPSKGFHSQIMATMRQVAQAERQGRFRRSGQTTQFVVGAADETDQDIIQTASSLYNEMSLARIYYSGFQPITGTPLAEKIPIPFMREHRLYQVDFLLRRYGFSLEEIPFSERGQLSLDNDPKTIWAQAHPEQFPVEINTASAKELMRVPGIGPVSAKRIFHLRQESPIRDLKILGKLGACYRIAAPYVLLDGKSSGAKIQLSLF